MDFYIEQIADLINNKGKSEIEIYYKSLLIHNLYGYTLALSETILMENDYVVYKVIEKEILKSKQDVLHN